MREPPAELRDRDVHALVAAHWDRAVDLVTHLPVGFGAHHWRADRGGVPTWFLTYDRFGTRHTEASLTAAYAGAIELADRGLEFVLAPVRTRTGRVLVPVAGGALSCTPWVEASEVGEGPVTDPATAAANLDDLRRLHDTRPPAGIPRWAPVVGEDLAVRLTALVAEPWTSGPHAEPVRRAITARLADVAAWSDRYLALGAAARTRPWVATHGETHTRNQLRTRAGIRFVDWESLKLGPRERDLTTLVGAGYGTAVRADPEMIELFDLEWRLGEIDAYARWFAAPHTGTADDQTAYEGLLEELGRGPLLVATGRCWERPSRP